MAVEEIYSSLNKLLEDICKFLADESNYTSLSPGARKHADELINRSKHQLQEISKITNECDGAYVDMEKKSVENGDDDNDIYVSVDEVITERFPPAVIQPPQNPYANLPAKELDQDLKHGALSWRCRIILKFEKMRKIYAGVHDNWLLIYSNEKESKPLQTFNLRHHKAQNVICKQGKNMTQDFELFTTVGERKSYYFVALTHKDMLQWVTHINRCNDSMQQIENSPIIEEDEPSETYEVITNTFQNNQNADDDDEEGEVFYYPIEELSSNHRPPKVDLPPELPLRRPPKTIVPVSPPVVEESKAESVESLPSRNGSNVSNSFSEEEEEGDYGVFVQRVSEKKNIDFIQNNQRKPVVNTNVSRTNSTKERVKPQTPVKPKFLAGKFVKNNVNSPK